MSIKKLDTGKWLVDIQPGGRNSKRIRKQFTTKSEALRFEAHSRTQHTQTPDWEPKSKPVERLSSLIDQWFALHGQHLKDGKNRLQKLQSICNRLGNPLAANFTAQMFTEYRSKRVRKVSENTINHEQAYLSAVFGELIRLGAWSLPNPLLGLRKLKIDEHELTFLSLEQIQTLLSAMDESRNPYVKTISMICLATGARWGEAENLTSNHIRDDRVTYTKTKTSKNRTVPLPEDVLLRIPKVNGRLFGKSYDAFTNALERSGIELPRGQRTHVLRHTFASHFIMNGGNILTLQKVLGHSTIETTMRYAHLAPKHLLEAVKFNPLTSLENPASSFG